MIKTKLFGFLALIIICQIKPLISGDLVLPDQIGEKWIAQDPVKKFVGGDLFNHINGGAELFLEFGFEYLTVCKYRNEETSLDLEIYKMNSPISALGIYLSKTGKETPISEIPVRNTANPYQIVITSGNYFIMVNNFTGNTQLRSLMIHLSQKIVNQIGRPEVVDLFTCLPKQDIIDESKIIFRGPFGLQSVYTFGKGDVLQLKGVIFGVGANYKFDSIKPITRLIIPYPDQLSAEKAYHNLVSNLDPYHEILKKSDDHFVFKDFNQEFGKVSIRDNQILIDLHLSSFPK
jgi:hypothetical protein